MQILNLLKKLPKFSCAKNFQRKSDRKIEVLTFIIVYKSFCPLTFWGDFWSFFDGFKFSIKFCVSWYWYQIFEEKKCLLKLSFFANFKAKFSQNNSKKQNMSLEIHFTSVSGLRGSIKSKKNSKLLYSTAHCRLLSGGFLWDWAEI